MLKVVKAKEMARAEALAYKAGASEEAFMLTAGSKIAEGLQEFIGHLHIKPNILLLCGKGNNGGDAYVAGSILRHGGFSVRACAMAPLADSSPLCQQMSRQFIKEGGEISYLDENQTPDLDQVELIVDGLYGTGFHGDLIPHYSQVISHVNQSNIPIVSIDIPSGINGDTGLAQGEAICATRTFFLGLPKVGCFLDDAYNHMGKAQIFDFGLDAEYVKQAIEEFLFVEQSDMQEMLPPVVTTRHKYEAGYVVGVGGSHGMPGAPLLTSFAALRAGAGIVRLLHPEGMEGEFSGAHPEIIRQGYRDAQTIIEAFKRASALFIGPGIGSSDAGAELLQSLFAAIDRPCVIDAEALTMSAHYKLQIPKGVVITPHHGEMSRLLGIEKKNPGIEELLSLSAQYSEQNELIVVLKGAPTFVLAPNCKPYLVARGDPGMATAGSGDVLTGIIAACLAQGKSALDGALLGVYLHAVAGERAAQKQSSYSMVASDITEQLGPLLKTLHQNTM